MLYLDAAATTPMRREALEAAWPYLTGEFGNPSSHHSLGERAAAGLTGARRRVARALGCRTGEVAFTSGGTEGDNLAIKGLALASPRGRHLVTAATEHEAVLASMDYLRRWHNFEVSFVEVTSAGVVTPAALAAVLREDTTLVSLSLANNEIGTVQDIAALAQVTHEHGALLHTDAVQAAGWLDLDVRALGVDALTVSGHKVGAGKGTGAVFLRGRLPVEPVLHGGGQERERRSGTENVAGAVALGAALTLAETERAERAERVTAARDAFIARVRELVPTAVLTGADPLSPGTGAAPAGAGPGTSSSGTGSGLPVRLPNHASFCFPGTSGEAVLLELEQRGVITSSGSACAAGADEPSHVLIACGMAPEVAQTSVRFTFGGDVGADGLLAAADSVGAAVAAVAQLS
ncbi:cysteine desulfurase family protein [Ruania albidiflava]|uniref:cysteine desulfurase family protein n=1 Tax=Ruania albidiflava TaxID=366586 RepID=UPI0003B743F7|nr:cysteine desulfurase family protein [Ruania albidiflava]